VEQGYACVSTSVVPSGSLILPIVYRDFKGVANPTAANLAAGFHPDFEHSVTKYDPGIVMPKLGTDGKPVHVALDMATTTNNDTPTTPDWFSIWYRDAVQDLPTAGSPRYNYTFVDTLTLLETAVGSGIFRYSNTSFFPLDGRTPSWGNTTGQSHNFHFTSEVRYWFQYRGGELLTFTGDDDVFVFVNKQLAVDLGGIHNALNGSVQLDASNGTGIVCNNTPPGCATAPIDFGLVQGSVYEIVVFQAERHTVQSNYTLTVSSFNATRSVCHPICGDGFVTPNEACDLGKDANTGAYGTCNPDCTLPPYCGDAIVQTDQGEQCDDGVNLATYGYNGTPACGPNCQLSDFCGDGKVDSLFGEQCDDGNHTPSDGCEPNCMLSALCGNGHLDPGEQCDDGNIISGDGCSQFCTLEISGPS
jgi:fibro-slime domain-containing protein